MEKSNFFQIDKSIVILLFLVVVLITSIFLLVNYRRELILSHNADETIAAIPSRQSLPSNQKVSPIPTIDPYIDWKIYEDEENGFTFKYPSDLYVTLNPNRDGKILLIISDDNRETLGPIGWRGIFVSILPNSSNYNSKTFIQWEVKNDPYNASVTIKKVPIVGLDASITQGEVISGISEPMSRIYISKDNRVFRFTPNHHTYYDILNKIIPTFNYL
ncbi:MAG: hypothetical protein WC503_05325 [Candidatus Shapirobacteria bacterium]